jgi:hypothetical protein
MPGTRNAYQPDFMSAQVAGPFGGRHDAAAFPEVVDPVHDDVGDQDRDQDQKPGISAARNSVESGDAQHEADDDVGDRGRDQDAGTGTCRDQRTGIGPRIAAFHQPVDGHPAHGGGTGSIGARDGREHAADQNRGRAEAALGPAGQRLGHIKKLSTEPGAHQHIAGQDEERDGGQREWSIPKQFSPTRLSGSALRHDQHHDRGRADRRPDRHGKRDRTTNRITGA